MKSGKSFKPVKPKFKTVLDYSLWLLSLRNYTEKEITTKIVRKNYPPTEIEPTLNKLKQLQLIDDIKYAVSWFRTRDVLKPKSHYLLNLELMKKGVSQGSLDQAWKIYGQTPDNLTDEARIEKLVALLANRSSFNKLNQTEKKQYTLNFLARRGFNYNLVSKFLAKIE